MATFKFGRQVNIHWNGFEVVGPAETVFSIPDQLYEEFEGDFRHVEPSLVWLDTNEFQTLENQVSTAVLSATFPVAIATSTSGKTISLSSSTNPNGYLLTADGSGGVIFTPASTSGLTSVVGISPISTIITGGTVSVSLTANYQTAGTYVTSVIGSSPVSASGTTAITVSIDQTTLSVADASTAATLRTYVKNSSGSTITKGQVVYITGADGTNALIGLASNTSDAASSKTLGIAANTMTNNAFGYVIENGQLSNIDTSAATAGSAVWLGSTPGSYQFIVPDEPNHAVYLGVVTKANASTGEILVKVQNGYELNELHDVFTTGVSTSLPLVYNAASDGWIAQALSSVGIADNAIVTTKILDAAVTSAKIGAGAINSTHIGANAVVAGDIAANAVTSGNIATGAVGSAALADNAVVAAKIAAASVGTAALSSGTATSGSVLTANGSGGVSFTAVSSTPESYYITGNSPVNGSSLTSIPSGRYMFSNWTGRQIRIEQNGTSTNTAIGSSTSSESIMVNQKSSMVARMPIGWTWNTVDIGTTSAVSANDVKYLNSTWYLPLSSGAMSRSTNGTSFTVSSALITTGELRDVEYGGSTFVACGDGGGIISSSNGTSWTIRTSGTTVALNAVAYGGGTFLIVGASGSALTSTDGTTWTSRTSGSSNAWLDVAYGASLFVVIQSTVVRTTPDGVTWTSRTIPGTVAGNLQRIAFANGVFVIGTANGEILTSSDGITWTEVFAASGNNVPGIAYLENSAWITSHTNGALAYSFDNAVTWSNIATINNSPVAITSLDSIRLGYGNNRIIAANDGTPESNGFTSTDSEPISFSLISLTSVTA